MSLPWVTDGDLLWDTLIMGGKVWPGLPTVDVKVTRKIDVQKNEGEDGATLKDVGYQPAEVSITIRMWLREQWEELQRRLAEVHPRRPGGSRQPVDIWHPMAQLLGVRQIYVTEIGELKPGFGPETGSFALSLKALEWFPATKPAAGNLKSAKSGGGTTGPGDGGAIPDPNEVLAPGSDGSATANIL